MAESTSRAGSTIGVLGSGWRADVDAWGDVVPTDPREVPWRWAVAADDRWHQGDGTVRRRRVEGTPVFETRVRVPSGDVVHTVWAATDRSGRAVVVMEFENDSPLPVVVSSSRLDAVSSRPVAARIDVPVGSSETRDRLLVPIGHRSTVRLVSPAGWVGEPDESAVPDSASVARGWCRIAEGAGRLVVPGSAGGTPLVDEIVAARVDALLDVSLDSALGLRGPEAVKALLSVDQRRRMGSVDGPGDSVDGIDPTIIVTWIEEVLRARPRRWRTDRSHPAARLALLAAERSLDDEVARGDLRRAVAAWRGGTPADVASAWGPPEGSTEWDPLVDDLVGLARLEDRLVRDLGDGRIALLPDGLPMSWLGQPIEVHGLPAGRGLEVSFALRWHGARPAILWEVVGGSAIHLSSGVDPGWWSTSTSGEALWAAPEGGAKFPDTGDDSISFG